MPSFLSRRDGQALVTRNGGRLLEEITEIESGKRNDRPELRRAICRGRSAGRVIIAQARQIEQKCGGRRYLSHALASMLSVVLPKCSETLGQTVAIKSAYPFAASGASHRWGTLHDWLAPRAPLYLPIVLWRHAARRQGHTLRAGLEPPSETRQGHADSRGHRAADLQRQAGADDSCGPGSAARSDPALDVG
jgi:hypothetical protein